MSKTKQKNSNKYSIFRGILIFGSIWGLLEATVGGALRLGLGPFFKSQLHICPCPFIVTLIGFPLMGAALAIYKKPFMIPGIGLLAASFSWLAVPFYNVPVFSTPYTTFPIVNPTIAILLSSIIFASLTSLSMKKFTTKGPTLVWVGALSSILTSIAFIYIVVNLKAPILAATGLNTPLMYIVNNGTVFAAICVLTLPLGYRIGLKTHLSLYSVVRRKPWLYHATPFAIIAICLLGSLISIWAGL